MYYVYLVIYHQLNIFSYKHMPKYIVDWCLTRTYKHAEKNAFGDKVLYAVTESDVQSMNFAGLSVTVEFNDAQRISFDDIFYKRRFNSYIVRENNVYNNRRINEYTFGGIPNLQESERIKLELFNQEHDLWEY